MSVTSLNAPDRTRVLVGAFILAWLSLAIYLFPLPNFSTFYTTDAVQGAIWRGWVITLLLVAFGLISGGLALFYQWAMVLVLISSGAYIVMWWAFSGYFDRDMSVVGMFRELWTASGVGGHRATFLHRDVVLVVFFHLLFIYLAFQLMRRSMKKSS